MRKAGSTIVACMLLFTTFSSSALAQETEAESVSTDTKVEQKVSEDETSGHQTRLDKESANDSNKASKVTEATANKAVAKQASVNTTSKETTSEKSTGQLTDLLTGTSADEEDSDADEDPDSVEEEVVQEEEQDEKEEVEKPSKTADKVVKEEKKETKKETDPKDKIEKAGVQKGGMHLNISYGEFEGDVDYIPNFTVQLRTPDKKVISTIKLGKQNYDKTEKAYKAVLNHTKGFKAGEKYQLYLKSADGVVKSLTFYDSIATDDGYNTTEWYMKPDQYAPFKIQSYVTNLNDSGTKQGEVLLPNQYEPLMLELKTDNKLTSFSVVTKKGQPVKNDNLYVKLENNKGTLKLKTDNEGKAYTQTSKLTDNFMVYSKEYIFEEAVESGKFLNLPIDIKLGGQDGLINYTLVVDVATKDLEKKSTQDNTNKGSGVKVSVKTSGNTDLSKQWTDIDLTFSNKKQGKLEYAVNHEGDTLSGIPNGTYKVTAKSEYANVKLSNSTVTVKNGTAQLTVSVSPKYTMEVDKDGKSYSFSVINVDSVKTKKYTGTGKTVFAVTAGENFMIEDNATGKVITVGIEDGKPVTKVILGVGVVFGGDVNTPHTGDIITILLWSLLGAVLLVIGLFLVYKRKKGKTSKAPMSLLLIAVMLGGLLPYASDNNKASADSQAGSGGSGGGSTSSSGIVQLDDEVGILQIGIIENKKSNGGYILNKSSSRNDMRNEFKFSDKNYSTMFYVPINSEGASILNDSSTAVVTFDYNANELVSLFGNNPLVTGDSAVNSRTQLGKRILDTPNSMKNSDNMFEKYVAQTILAMGGSSSGRQLWAGKGSDTSSSYGTSFSKEFKGISDDLKKGNGKINIQGILYGYAELLDGLGGEYKAYSKALTEQFETSVDDHREDEFVMVANVLQDFYVKGASPRKHALVPMHEASEWYLKYRKKSRKGWGANIHKSEEARITNVSGDKGTSLYAKEAPMMTYVSNTRATTQKAIKPKSTKVKGTSPSSNPFQGWGYQVWGNDEFRNAKPKLSVKVRLNIKGKNGSVKKVTVTPSEYSDPRVISDLADPTNFEGKRVKGTTTIPYGGKIYRVSGTSAKFNLYEIDGDGSEEKLNKSKMKKNIAGTTGTFPVSPSSSNWQITLGTQTPPLLDLNYYLGGGTKTIKDIDKKYPKGKYKYANARLLIDLEVEDTAVKKKVSHDIEEWQLSKYVPDLSDNDPTQSHFMVNPISIDGYDLKLTPSGSITFTLKETDVSGTKWLDDNKAILMKGDSKTKSITTSQTTASFWLSGKTLPVRANDSVHNIKTAKWVNDRTLFNGAIGSENKGSASSSDVSTKSKNLEYWAETGTSFTWNWKKDHVTETKDKNGKVTKKTTTEAKSAGATTALQKAVYDSDFIFKRYNPEKPDFSPVIADETENENAKFVKVTQSKAKFGIYPEVAYSYDDFSGNKSVLFVAGFRTMYPFTYMKSEYRDVAIDAKVNGTSVATNREAKVLASKLHSGGKEVIHKGSALTSSFKVDGKYEMKFFTVDIGDTSLKSFWNSSMFAETGKTYSTDSIVEKLLEEEGGKKSGSSWEMPFDARGYVTVNGLEIGGKLKTLMGKQKGSKKVVEHKIVLRSGELFSVDGQKDFTKLEKELQEAVNNMNLYDSPNLVFHKLESGQGADLDDAKYATLANALRGGTTDIKMGEPWYNEDSTVLIIREYVYEFDVPDHAFAEKIPMTVDGLETPRDKNQFYSAGTEGHTVLRYQQGNNEMEYDSSTGEYGGDITTDFLVPNVSVLDTFN